MVVVEVNGYKIEPGANLTGADLSGVLLGGADLTGANLKGVYLEGANLSGANLHMTNLSGANLTGVFLGARATASGRLVPVGYEPNLNRTVADRNTRWPERFDPVAAGVIIKNVAASAPAD